VQWAQSLGIGAQEIKLELGGAASGLTQYDSASVVQVVTTNGTAFGNLSNVAIDEDGFVTAIFDNGVTRRIAQVAIATFPNPDGLIAENGNSYRLSGASGGFSLKAPGTGGAGYLAPSTLESSTVDLSTEFTGLITTQRAYSASSKIITTADQMLEELLTIKR
jgi:flagellar hook protein FlgE